MSIKQLVGLMLLASLAGCEGVVVVDRPHYRRPPPVVYEPAPVVYQAAPAYVEEGAYVNGAVVVPPAYIDGYVSINGGWYYWHPGFHAWVHAHPSYGWHPDAHVRVYHDWSEHPMYHRPAAVVAQPAPVVVARSAPAYVEEGAVIRGAVVVAPRHVDGYVSINGGWYYWHPDFHAWVHAHPPRGWHPGGDVHVYHDWSEHPMYHH